MPNGTKPALSLLLALCDSRLKSLNAGNGVVMGLNKTETLDERFMPTTASHRPSSVLRSYGSLRKVQTNHYRPLTPWPKPPPSATDLPLGVALLPNLRREEGGKSRDVVGARVEAARQETPLPQDRR